jgi:membrane-associated phospholipid phosphatase
MLPIIILLVLLSGILASSRLYLKAHTPVELLIGFSLGIVCQFILFISLQ